MNSTKSEISDTLQQINHVLKSSSNHYANYSCKTVSWDDVQRGTVGGGLSCWGANITDTRLYAKDGRQLFTVRGDNWNERLAKVSADDLMLVANGNDNGNDTLQPFTLRHVLQNIRTFGGYAGIKCESLDDEMLDNKVSVRFQTTFLPVNAIAESRNAALEFATEAYNYNTMSDEDPRNLILLCTTQGIAVQADGYGSKRLYHHDIKSNGTVSRHWLEAEESKHKVGGEQKESDEERLDALSRNKATSSEIGVRGIGSRFNVLMTIQVPLRQKPNDRDDYYGGTLSYGYSYCSAPYSAPTYDYFGASFLSDDVECDEGIAVEFSFDGPVLALPKSRSRGFPSINFKTKRKGKSSAARVSKGSFVDEWDGLTIQEPKRHSNEHCTATIVMYYTCNGGVPTSEDINAAIDDIEELYRGLEGNGQLSDNQFDFMKSELTVKDVNDISKKIINQ